MSDKPTHASVTDVPCTCDYLQRAAEDAVNPVVFDERTNEYQFKYFDTHDQCCGMLIIFHCPFCGGAAPKSKRKLLFAVVPRGEEERLAEMLLPIETIDDAIDKLGKPDFDDYSINRHSEQDGTPPSTVYYREIRYDTLSSVVVICITERPDGRVYWQIVGKHL